METGKTKKGIALTSFLVASILVAFSFASMPVPTTRSGTVNFYWYVTAPDGSVPYSGVVEGDPLYVNPQYGSSHNLITDFGLDWLVNQTAVAPVAEEKAVYMYLSTNDSAPAADWTYIHEEILTAEGNLGRVAGTVTWNANANVSIAHTWTANATVEAIACIGLGISSVAGNTTDLFAAAQITPTVNLASGWNFTGTWVFTAANDS